MKKGSMLILIVLLSLMGEAQTFNEWFRQDKTQIDYLKKQIVKLQLYLSYVKKGYAIVNKGLTTIGEIKGGDFRQHLDFFGRQKTVSPVVRKYEKVARIVRLQREMISLSKEHRKQFGSAGVFDQKELRFINALLTGILDKAADGLEELMLLVTDGQLEMVESERLSRIDRLCASLEETHAALVSFCRQTTVHAKQRKHERNELHRLQKLY